MRKEYISNITPWFIQWTMHLFFSYMNYKWGNRCMSIDCILFIMHLTWANQHILTWLSLCPSQVWFKNRRAKCRQQQKAAEQANKSGGSTGSNSNSKESASSPSGCTSTGTSLPVKKSKSPCLSDGSASPPAPASAGAGGGYKPPAAVSSPSSCSSAPGIWSPAVPPMSELMNSASSAACMQRPPAGYPMSNQSMHAPYGSQNYGAASSYYGNMDYLSPMQLPIMTSGQQMSPVSSISSHGNMNMSGHMTNHMTANQMGSAYCGTQGLSRTPGGSSSGGDSSFDYKDNNSWPKFQIL